MKNTRYITPMIPQSPSSDFSGALSRPLGQSERFFTIIDLINSVNVAFFAEISGDFKLEQLQIAVDLAIQKYPILRSRIIVKNWCSLAFEPVMPAKAQIDIRVKEYTNWQKQLANELDIQFALNSYPLIRVNWFCDKSTKDSVFSLVCHHSICDGIAGCALLKDILSNATTPKKYMVVETKEALPCLEDIFPTYYMGFWGLLHTVCFFFRNIWDSMSYGIPKKIPDFKQSILKERDINIIATEFDQQEGNRLYAKCQRERTTLQGAFCAAIFIALSQEFKTQNTVTLSLGIPVSLRNRLAIRVYPDDLGVYIGHIMLNQRISSETKFWDLARQCSGKLQNSVGQGSSHLIWKTFPPKFFIPANTLGGRIMNMVVSAQPHGVMVTNVGQLGKVDLSGKHQLHSLSFAMCPENLYAMSLAITSINNKTYVNFTHSNLGISQDRVGVISERFQNIIRDNIE